MTMPTTPLPKSDPLAALPRLDRHKPKCGPVRASKAGPWRARVLIFVHVLILVHVLLWWWFGETLTPVEPSEAMQTLELGRINAGFLLFCALILSTLVFGRWFCGWACHVVALQDLSAWLLGRAGLKPRPVRSRLLLFAPFVVAFHMFAQPQIEHWLDPVERPRPRVEEWEWHLTTDAFWATFPGWIMSIATVLVVGFLIVWWMGAKGFCNFGCPYGAFFAVADRFAPLRIKVTDACDACGHCTSVCTSNVRVHEEVAKYRKIVDPACMKCMDCVSVCPKEALYVGFAAPRPWSVSQQRIKARADFTWGEEALVAIVAVVATQWGFRFSWFGERIPFLLSVGLGVITAALAVLGWRLWRKPELQFQHTAVKVAGRLTTAGRRVAVGVTAWLLFALHTGVLNQWTQSMHDTAGKVWNEQRATRAVAIERLQEAAAALTTLDRWSLWTPPRLLALHGLLLREIGDHELAIRQLERMVTRRGLDPERHLMAPADNALANYYAGLGRIDEAEALARGVLEHQPGDRTAQALLEMIGRQR